MMVCGSGLVQGKVSLCAGPNVYTSLLLQASKDSNREGFKGLLSWLDISYISVMILKQVNTVSAKIYYFTQNNITTSVCLSNRLVR